MDFYIHIENTTRWRVIIMPHPHDDPKKYRHHRHGGGPLGLANGKAQKRKRLIRRFGPLPARAAARLAAAELAQLEAWGERVLEAAALEAVFAEG